MSEPSANLCRSSQRDWGTHFSTYTLRHFFGGGIFNRHRGNRRIDRIKEKIIKFRVVEIRLLFKNIRIKGR